jgi:hypothetical protein
LTCVENVVHDSPTTRTFTVLCFLSGMMGAVVTTSVHETSHG